MGKVGSSVVGLVSVVTLAWGGAAAPDPAGEDDGDSDVEECTEAGGVVSPLCVEIGRLLDEAGT